MESLAISCVGHVSSLSYEQMEAPESVVSAVPVVDDVVSVLPIDDADAASDLVLILGASWLTTTTSRNTMSFTTSFING